MRESQDPEYPLTVFYAFKQAEGDDESDGGTAAITSTGWETMLEGLLKARFQVTGTWPIRSERPTGVKVAINALASSYRPCLPPASRIRGYHHPQGFPRLA